MKHTPVLTHTALFLQSGDDVCLHPAIFHSFSSLFLLRSLCSLCHIRSNVERGCGKNVNERVGCGCFQPISKISFNSVLCEKEIVRRRKGRKNGRQFSYTNWQNPRNVVSHIATGMWFTLCLSVLCVCVRIWKIGKVRRSHAHIHPFTHIFGEQIHF